MDTTEFRPQLHIAQQSRRDKLRIQQDFAFYDYDTAAAAADVRHYRGGNICYDPSEICSEMINFSAKRGGGEPTPPPFQAFPRDNIPPSFNSAAAAAAAASSDPQFFNTWKSIGLQQLPATSDWAASHNTALDVVTGASSNYQNSLQELVNSSDGRTFGLEFASLRQKSDSGHGPWAVGGSELHLLPAYADQWSGGELDRGVTMAANDHPRALSLSLSSVPSPKVHETQTAERDFNTREVHQDSRNWNPSYGRPLGPQALTHRNPGPLGPFTGYSTILRSSKFLRPAQQLLEDLCCISRPRSVVGAREVSDEIMEDVRVSNEIENAERGSGAASFTFDGEKRREAGGTSCSTDAYGSENFQRKAKLLFMQDEVWKRSKQYQQQMQMVVSSFETVAGLNAATPYVSLALKAISKHFRSLKSAITDQIKCIKSLLGEELSSTPTSGGGSSSSKGEGNASMLKFFDPSFHKQKGSGGDNLGILEGTHIWRPQRGLPERAVSILRAWLFDHFLHPYPTDTDKHMLASQTGLTRNQVSNWFINARVRVWKPMVEEIHMLETKGSLDNGKTTTEECDEGGGFSNRGRMCTKQVESSAEVAENTRSSTCMWNQEKRSRIEYDGSLMGLVGSTHQRNGAVEMMGGMGAVSLTLGLRQSAEQERNLRCYGGQILRDFVG